MQVASLAEVQVAFRGARNQPPRGSQVEVRVASGEVRRGQAILEEQQRNQKNLVVTLVVAVVELDLHLVGSLVVGALLKRYQESLRERHQEGLTLVQISPKHLCPRDAMKMEVPLQT